MWEELAAWLGPTEGPEAGLALLAAGVLRTHLVEDWVNGVDELARWCQPTIDELGGTEWPIVVWRDPTDWVFRVGAEPARLAHIARGVISHLPEAFPYGRTVRLSVQSDEPVGMLDLVLQSAADDPTVLATTEGRFVVATHRRLPRPSSAGRPAPRWDWPLRIGASGPLLASLRGVPGWIVQLATLVDLERPWPTCSLALVDEHFAASGVQLRAAAVVSFGTPISASFLGAAGCLLGVGDVDPGSWLNRVLEELAHDAPIDVAVHTVSRLSRQTQPIIFADAGFLRRARVRSTLLEAAVRPSPQRRAAGDDVALNLIDAYRDGLFQHESQDATTAAGDLRRLQEGFDNRQESRFLTVELAAGGEVVPGFRPEREHELAIWIGPFVDDGAIALTRRFPDEDLPWQGNDLPIDVVLMELRPEADVMVEPVLLPPVGASGRATFTMGARAAGDTFRARVAVLHANRFIQTALLTAVVADPPVSLVLAPESLVRPTGDALAELVPHQAAIVLNHDGTDRLIAIIADGAANIRSPRGLDELLLTIRGILKRAVSKPDDFTRITQLAFSQMIVDLAEQGSELHRVLIGGRRTALVAAEVAAHLVKAERISILSAVPDAILPLELLYDRELVTGPGQRGELCPNAAEALSAGECPATCGAEPHIVCPLRFWGFRKVIERHANPVAARAVRDDYVVFPSPSILRHEARMRTVLVGASARADNQTGAWAVAEGELQTLLAGGVEFATTWPEWRTKIEQAPAVLLLLPHVERLGSNTYLEIGTDGDLSFTDDLGPYLGARDDGPIVLLLGCSTGAGDAPIEEWPGKLLDEGAKLVLATMTVVRGRQVAPLATELMRTIEDIRLHGHGGVQFGEALLRLRRAMLPTNPMVLSLVAYGDADWVLAGDG